MQQSWWGLLSGILYSGVLPVAQGAMPVALGVAALAEWHKKAGHKGRQSDFPVYMPLWHCYGVGGAAGCGEHGCAVAGTGGAVV
ncbi:MAG: hypothetical protein EBZ77_17020, partial [Chitinophagia bacterium]|nr:hypothetical protein [Chitinophagia bacterium]